MKINIVTSSRFHLLDLARELSSCGCDVKFYSWTSGKICRAFGLGKNEYCSFFLFLLPFIPFYYLERKGMLKGKYRKWLFALTDIYLDNLAVLLTRQCDILIGISGVCVKILEKGKKSPGTMVLLERGCSHVEEQISSCSMAIKPTLHEKNRELNGYEIADVIVLGSSVAADSFLKRGFQREKIFIDSYGVSTCDFSVQILDKVHSDLIFVGAWSSRKGCDLLEQALALLPNVTLRHIGTIGDIPFPMSPQFKHIDPVPQQQLPRYYKQSKVMILASREDGFGLVVPQAMCCGLPVVCSPFAGASDLKNILPDPKWMVMIEELTPEGIAEAIRKALVLAETQPEGEFRDYLGDARETLSWRAYGKRYYDFLQKITVHEGAK